MSKFMFFDNFKETADKLPDDLRLKFYDAMTDYVFKGIEPDDVVISALITAIKPSLDKEEKRGGNHNPNGINQHKAGQTEVKKEVKEVKAGQSGQSFLETETETETETRKDSLATSCQTKYAFEGKVIRLNQSDFSSWEQAFPDLNLRAELMVRDDWLSNQPEPERKRWFISTQQYFIKQNERRKAQSSALNDNNTEVEEDLESWLQRSVL